MAEEVKLPEEMFPDDDEALRNYLINTLKMTPFMAGQYIEIARGRSEGDVVVTDDPADAGESEGGDV